MNPDLNTNNNQSVANFQAGHKELPIGKILLFLSHKGIKVDSDWKELSGLRKLQGEDKTRRRDALIVDVTNKAHSLSQQDQEELNNSLLFGGNRYRKADNGKWMTRGSR